MSADGLPSDSCADVEFLFYRATLLGPEERLRLLERECGTNQALRAELETMLRDHEEAGSFLDGRAPKALLHADVPRLKPEEPGDRLGHYKLLEQIGEGGFGTVWVAEQERPIRRRVALKIIKLGMDTREVVARFDQERQALAMMDHPNIAKVFDADATPAGRPFFVMELVRGMKITDYSDQAMLPTADRLRLFVQVCQAVQHAHQKGVIHRDLKPSNILVTLHDGVAVPKVIDFGVAKATQQQRLTDLTVYTKFEQMIGTPLYMSPEQAEMSGLDVDTRSDIYSLGVLLYELLTGQPPYDPEKLANAGLDEMRRVIREEEPLKPSTLLSTLAQDRRATVALQRQSDNSKLIKSIRGDLDWVVMKALEKDRNRRYSTPNDFASDLQRHLVSEPVLARPPSTLYRFRRFVRRYRLGVAAGSAVVLSLVLGFITSAYQARRAESAALQARTEAQRANREAIRAVAAEQAQRAESKKALAAAHQSRTVAKFLEEMLGGVKPEVAVGRDTAMLREILDKTAGRLDELKDLPEVEAEVRRIVGDAYVAIGEAGRGAEILKEALGVLQRSVGTENLAYASVLLSYSRILPSEVAERAVREVLDIRRKLLGPDHPDVALALTRLAFAVRSLQRYADAEKIAGEAVAMCRKHFGERHPHTAQALLALAQSVGWQQRPAESEAIHREILTILRSQHGNTHPDLAISLLNLSQALYRQKKLKEAEAAAREAREVARAVFGPAHPSYPQMGGHLGTVLLEEKKFDEAEKLAFEEWDIGGKLQFPSWVSTQLGLLRLSVQGQGKSLKDHAGFRDRVLQASAALDRGKPNAARQLHSLGHLFAEAGEPASAEDVFREEITLARKLPMPPRYIITSQVCLAKLLEFRGDFRRAEPVRREIATEVERAFPDDLSAIEDMTTQLTDCLYRQRKYREASGLYEQVIASRSARYAPDHNQLLLSRASLARLLTDWAWSELGYDPISPSGQKVVRSRQQMRQPHSLAASAEQTLSETLQTRLSKKFKDEWRFDDLRSRLGSAMAAVAASAPTISSTERDEKFAAAETMLLQSRQVLADTPDLQPKYVRDALARLVNLYAAWGKLEKATNWKKELDAASAGLVESELSDHHPSDAEPKTTTPAN